MIIPSALSSVMPSIAAALLCILNEFLPDFAILIYLFSPSVSATTVALPVPLVSHIAELSAPEL